MCFQQGMDIGVKEIDEVLLAGAFGSHRRCKQEIKIQRGLRHGIQQAQPRKPGQ